MPDISIVIKATDQFSVAIKTMSDSSKAFTKDMDGMQSKLNALNKTKATLQVDAKKAKAELTAQRETETAPEGAETYPLLTDRLLAARNDLDAAMGAGYNTLALGYKNSRHRRADDNAILPRQHRNCTEQAQNNDKYYNPPKCFIIHITHHPFTANLSHI